MADREGLRQIVLSKAFRRIIFGAILLLGIWFVVRSLQQGSVADRCAEELAAAVSKRDRAYLSEHIRNPSLEETLLSAASAELAFVRPVDPEWSRIGFLTTATASSAVQQPVFILLSHERSQERCVFIQDYDAK
jgi:hypothetical protein